MRLSRAHWLRASKTAVIPGLNWGRMSSKLSHVWLLAGFKRSVGRCQILVGCYSELPVCRYAGPSTGQLPTWLCFLRAGKGQQGGAGDSEPSGSRNCFVAEPQKWQPIFSAVLCQESVPTCSSHCRSDFTKAWEGCSVEPLQSCLLQCATPSFYSFKMIFLLFQYLYWLDINNILFLILVKT